MFIYSPESQHGVIYMFSQKVSLTFLKLACILYSLSGYKEGFRYQQMLEPKYETDQPRIINAITSALMDLMYPVQSKVLDKVQSSVDF